MRPAALTMLAALLIGGCGSSKPNAHDAFVAKANAICSQADKRAKKSYHPRSKVDRAGEALGPSEVEALSVSLKRAGRELASLSVPAPMRQRYQQFVAAYRAEAVMLGKLAAAERTYSAAAMEGIAADAKATKLVSRAEALGLKACR